MPTTSRSWARQSPFEVPVNSSLLNRSDQPEVSGLAAYIPGQYFLDREGVAMSASAGSREAKSGRPLILVVDDDRVTVRLLDRLLHSAGFSTLLAGDLASAEALLKEHPITLVLLDVHLPDGNGLDFCAQMSTRAVLSDIPVLFISSNSDEATKVQGFASGAVDYITKPLAAGEVLARVRTHLRLRMAYEALARFHAERIEQIAVTQQSLMPLPDSIPEAKFAVCIRQFHGAGGDFYDVFMAGDRTSDYVVADASGHNLGVSLWTASFKALLAEYASVLNTPSEILAMINRTLRRVLPETAYFTAIYARLNREFNTLTVASAGHPPAVLVPANGGPARVLHQEGDVVGIFPDPIFSVLEMRVQPGDRIYLCTDGLIELTNSRSEGIARLEEACGATAHMPLAEALPAIVDRLCDGWELDDDIILQGICV
jgi:sigma-B regulation protein RsbU (phosphoserine phosphatase)